MKSNTETNNPTQTKKEPEIKSHQYTYEEWIKTSIDRFKKDISKPNHPFDENDHNLANKNNKFILEELESINNAWWKSLKIHNLITFLTKNIMTINPLQSSTYILAEKTKSCLEDLNKIDTSLVKVADDNSKWFYELIEKYNVKQLTQPLIKQLDQRIKIHLKNKPLLTEENSRPKLHI